ncbi:MAG: FGGY family carbohydrate kinase, partial [Caulobacterales bacterium]
MAEKYIAAIDQGTTSSRCIIFDASGAIAAISQKEHRQIYPRPGWVEHDAEEIWSNVRDCVHGALSRLKIRHHDLAAVGVTNQRETTLLWRKSDGRPLHNAIVWQDTRTDTLARDLGGDAGQDRFRARCGLPLSTYFSGPKLRWLLDNIYEARAAAERGELLFGTMDCWIIWKLTGRHVTDVTNASRTMLMNLQTLDWDEEILNAMQIPQSVLPEIRASSEIYGKATGEFSGLRVAGA